MVTMMTATLANSTPPTTRLLMALVAGIIIGCLFYGGLWWTIQKRLGARRAALWFVGGFVVRMVITVGGIYWVANGQWQRLVACMLGFVAGRLLVHWYTGRQPNQSNRLINTALAKDDSYAP